MRLTETLCWHCSEIYSLTDPECPHCCATNGNLDMESAQIEAADNSRIDHDWVFEDASFDHEYGTEQVYFDLCSRCGKERPAEPPDYDYFEEGSQP